MQFTELSEVEDLIRSSRMRAFNSPNFHDYQDPEVDRCFNLSPAVSEDFFTNIPSPVGDPVPDSFFDDTDDDITREKSSSLVDNESPPVSPSSINKNDGLKTPKPRVVTFDQSSPTSLMKFTPEPIDNSSSSIKPSQIQLALAEESNYSTASAAEAASTASNNTTAVSSSAMTSNNALSAKLKLRIYLPDTSEMNIEVYDIATVAEAIERILIRHKSENRAPPLATGPDAPSLYELRLHDTDGLPDEDFPALDRSRKVANFGDAGNHEYCLCERPGAVIVIPSPSVSPPTAFNKKVVKIVLPNEDYAMMAIECHTTGEDLLPLLEKKHRVLSDGVEYVFYIDNDDEEVFIDLKTPLYPLDVSQVTLAKRRYADSPQSKSKSTVRFSNETTTSKIRPGPEEFMFNDTTAAMYKEWQVIKTNKYGKKQHRMIGIDMNKIYNTKVGERAVNSKPTTRAERFLSTIHRINFIETDVASASFRITFGEPDAAVIDYEAQSSYDCAEIVAKIKYILSRKLSTVTHSNSASDNMPVSFDSPSFTIATLE